MFIFKINCYEKVSIGEKLSTAKIEKGGIIALENFLSESNLLESYISVGDKYPVWDGEILIYKIEDHNGNKENLRCRVPVQVKSKHGQWKEKETFGLKRNDLKLYSGDGGVLFIRPIYLTTTNYRIYAKALLPVDIYRLLRKSNNKKPAIDLKSYANIQDFVNLLLFFNENRKHQYNFTEDKTNKYMTDTNNEIVLNCIGIKGNDPISTLFSRDSFIYIKTKYDELIPTTLELSELKKINNEPVKINEKVYFPNVTRVFRKNSDTIFDFNSALSLRIEDKDIKLDINSSNKTKIVDTISAFEFLKDIEVNKHYYIGNNRVNCEILEKNNLDVLDIDLLNKILYFLKTLKVETKHITFDDYNKNSQLVNNLAGMLIDNRNVIIDRNEKSPIFKVVTLFDKKILLLFENIHDNLYSCQNFMTAKISNMSLTDRKEAVPCSKYFGLGVIFKDGFHSNIEILLDYKELVLKEMFEMYLPEIFNEYLLFGLECIKGYDLSQYDEALDIAEELFLFLKNKNIEKDSLNILIINLMQINYRRRKLDDSEVQDLLNIRNSNMDNNQLVCCIHILLESHRELEIILKGLDKKERNEIKSWPIWNLYNKAI